MDARARTVGRVYSAIKIKVSRKMVDPVKRAGAQKRIAPSEAPSKSQFQPRLTGFQKFLSFFIPPLRGYFEESSVKEQLMNEILSKIGPIQIYKPLLEKFSTNQLKHFNVALGVEETQLRRFLNTITKHVDSKEGINFLKEYLPSFMSEKNSDFISNAAINFAAIANLNLDRALTENEAHNIFRFIVENQNNKQLLEGTFAFLTGINDVPRKLSERIRDLSTILQYPEIQKKTVIQRIVVESLSAKSEEPLSNPTDAVSIARQGLVYERKNHSLSLTPFIHNAKTKNLVTVEKENVNFFSNAIKEAKTTVFSSNASFSMPFPTSINANDVKMTPKQVEAKVKWTKQRYVTSLTLRHENQEFTRDYVLKSPSEAEEVLLRFKAEFINKFL